MATDALDALGGRTTLVQGAKLKQRIVHSSGGDPTAFDDFLAVEGLKFSKWLDTLDGIVVYRRVGTDMLVGFKGAAWPTQGAKARVAASRAQLRGDVYQALTQVEARGYFYSPGTDTFAVGPTEDPDAILLPRVDLADLIDERRAFAANVESADARQALQEALLSSNPLRGFQRKVIEHQLRLQWHTFKFDRLLSALERWAGSNELGLRPEWYDAQLVDDRESPRQILAKLSEHMSEDEIRNLHIPIRAIEEWYRSERHGQSRRL